MPVIDSNPSTSFTLIRRMVDDSASGHAWQEFDRRYRRVLLRWCRVWGLSIQDTDDIVQDSLMAVFRFMPEFERRRKGAFRSWMKLITLRSWQLHFRRAARSPEPGRLGELQRSSLFGPEPIGGADILKLLDRIADEEILELAILSVRQKVTEPVWDIFESVELRNIPVCDIAKARGITPTAVRVNNFRVRKLLREFVGKFESS